MSMPPLDSNRYVAVMPGNPDHPVPTADGRYFSGDAANPDLADLFDPHVAQLLADGSLRRACDVETAAAKAVADKSAAAKAASDKAAAEQAAADKVSTDKAPADKAAPPPRAPLPPAASAGG